MTPWTVCSPPGSSVHGISQTRIFEWVAISFSRWSSRPRDQTLVSCLLNCWQILYWLSHWDAVENQRTKRGSSAGKESACNAGDPDSIPDSGRSPGEGLDYPLQYSWVSLVAQMLKNLPEMRKTWVQSLGWEDPLGDDMAAHSSILAWRIPMDRRAWQATVHGVTNSQTDWVTKHSTAHTTLWEKWGWIGNQFYPINIRMGDCYSLKWEGMWKGLQQYLAHDRCSMLLSELLSGSVIKNLPANAGDAGGTRGSGRSPGTGNGNTLQYSDLGNPMDRGAWQATYNPWGCKTDMIYQLNNKCYLTLNPCEDSSFLLNPKCPCAS